MTFIYWQFNRGHEKVFARINSDARLPQDYVSKNIKRIPNGANLHDAVKAVFPSMTISPTPSGDKLMEIFEV